MTSLKVSLMVTSSLTATTFLGGYLSDLKAAGWDVTLICSDGPGVAELVQANGVAFEALRMEREPSPIKDLLALYRAWRLLRRLRPDVVVYATPKASLIGAIASRFAGIPVRIYELWGLRLETATGISRGVFAALESLTARLSSEVVANSRSLADRAHALGVDGGHEIQVIGAGSSHGVDADHFRPDAELLPLEARFTERITSNVDPVVGFVGRLHPDKGVDTLFDALERFHADGGAFQLMLVGGDEGAALERRIEELRLIAPVYTLGHAQDVRPALRAMDVLVLPSRREGFPNVVLEAAAMETPSVVSDATGCRDSVIEGVTGMIVPVDDAVALADALNALFADPALRSRMGHAARRWAIEGFDPAAVRRAHVDFWKSSLSNDREG